MGYFSNGTEGEQYEDKWCSRCVHASAGCAVWRAHLLHNYDQSKNKEVSEILDILIPRSKDGLGNNKCTMFKALKTGSDPDDGEPLLFERHEIGGRPVEIKESA